MPIVGHGIDIVEVERFRGLIERHGERFLGRCFTPEEVAYAGRRPQRFAEHFAARFAAKEAVLKALGTGWRDGIAWTDIEIRRDPAGAPSVHLSGQAASLAAAAGISRWLISLSHTADLAQASVIGMGEVR